jgi:hypothetical protein
MSNPIAAAEVSTQNLSRVFIKDLLTNQQWSLSHNRLYHDDRYIVHSYII